MEISERREGNVLVLSIAGRLDNTGSDVFREHTLQRIREGATSLVVDLAGTTYVASMGIRALFMPAQELSRAKGRMVLTGLNAEVKNLFLIAGLLDLFQTFESVEAALAKGGW